MLRNNRNVNPKFTKKRKTKQNYFERTPENHLWHLEWTQGTPSMHSYWGRGVLGFSTFDEAEPSIIRYGHLGKAMLHFLIWWATIRHTERQPDLNYLKMATREFKPPNYSVIVCWGWYCKSQGFVAPITKIYSYIPYLSHNN